MPRSIWKNPFSENQIFKDIYLSLDSKKPIRLLNRHTVIFPTFIGRIFSVYNGKNFVNIQISEKMIGYKFGEFVLTRKKAIHKKK
jgi:small subunit ribosomal protein S19